MTEQAPKTATTTILEAALGYLRRGWAVIPCCYPAPNGGCLQHGPKCQHPGKVPLVKWTTYETHRPTEAEIQSWFPIFQGCKVNIGIVTGAISGLVVIDLDSEDAKPPPGKGFGITPMDRTGKGHHLYYRHPGGVLRNNGKRIWPSIDWRADGGFAVLPPSLHQNGNTYTWLEGRSPDDMDLAPLPEWFLEGVKASSDRGNGQSRLERGWVSRALLGAEDGYRDNTCIKLAGYFRNVLPYDVTLALMLMWAERCSPPFPPGEVEKTVASAYKYTDKAQVKGVQIVP